MLCVSKCCCWMEWIGCLRIRPSAKKPKKSWPRENLIYIPTWIVPANFFITFRASCRSYYAYHHSTWQWLLFRHFPTWLIHVYTYMMSSFIEGSQFEYVYDLLLILNDIRDVTSKDHMILIHTVLTRDPPQGDLRQINRESLQYLRGQLAELCYLESRDGKKATRMQCADMNLSLREQPAVAPLSLNSTECTEEAPSGKRNPKKKKIM